MQIQPVKTEKDYLAAMQEIEGLMDAPEGSEEEARLELLSILVEAYERAHYPIEAPDPVEAIRFYMEQRGLSPKDLEPSIGTRGRVHEILHRKRSLTLPMIRKLHKNFGIPAEALIAAPGRI